jgi:GNAT superfamily N-acetyltransferase
MNGARPPHVAGRRCVWPTLRLTSDDARHIVSVVTDTALLLAAYDDQLRTDAETPGALEVVNHGPLRLATFPRGRGFVSYRDLRGPDGTPADAESVRALVAAAADLFRRRDDVDEIEWKTRGHDHAPGLHESLLEHGFEPEESESIMVGLAAGLDVDVALPEGVTLRRVTSEADVRAMSAAADEAFGDPVSPEHAVRLLFRLERDPDMELWVAEADGRIVSSGRLEPVPNSDFAGVWGGSTLPAWRGRGIYRALTAARARSALARGKTLIHSDSTEYSRPILERYGLVKVSTTTPYVWRRAGQA